MHQILRDVSKKGPKAMVGIVAGLGFVGFRQVALVATDLRNCAIFQYVTQAQYFILNPVSCNSLMAAKVSFSASNSRVTTAA
jgi:hypothetical protein